jgi:carbon-monoxide dehydrogenase medium subunit
MVTFYRRLPHFDYLSPETLDDVLTLLAQHKAKAKLIAGGTDLVPQLKGRLVKTPQYIIDLKKIAELDYIKYDAKNGLAIGALATIKAIIDSKVVRDKFGVLAQAAENMASPQVRNRGTIAGNICNAVPSADSAPTLLVLEARLKLVSQRSERTVAISDFFTGPNRTALADDEMLLEIQLPTPPPHGKGVYFKLGPRKAMDLAIVGVAVLAVTDKGKCQNIRIALESVAPTPIRAKKAEAILREQMFDDKLIAKAAQTAAGETKPIDDHRASAEYRRQMVAVLTERAIKQALRS